MLSLTVDQIRELDRRTVEEYQIPSLLLMEAAGKGLAQSILNQLNKQSHLTQVPIVCGGGNNAGDGFVAARILHQSNAKVALYLLTPKDRFQGDALTNFKIAEKLGVPIFPFAEFNKTVPFHNTPVILIDAILGTGFKGNIRPEIGEAIAIINKFKKYHNAKVVIFSVDIPSGLNGDTGPVEGEAVRADVTVTFVGRKKGFDAPGAKSFTGKIEIVDIGIPKSLLKNIK